MTSNKRGFTLVELVVVIAMIAIFMASVGAAVAFGSHRGASES